MARYPSQHQRTLPGSNSTTQLFTNHYTCSFADNIPLYQYDVAIEEVHSRSGNWNEVRSRPRCSLIMQSIICDHQLNPDEIVWYDEQKCLYSTSELSTPQTKVSEDGQSRIQIKSLTNQWSTNDVNNYINGTNDMFPTDAIRILETLLKRSMHSRIRIINNTCYFVNDAPENLHNGFERRKGFIQALHLSSNTLTLNIQTKLTTFYAPVPLLDFICLYSGADRISPNFPTRDLNKILKNCLIVTKQSNWKKAYKFQRFDNRRPQEIPIDSGDSLVEYYLNLGFALQHPDYPCIEVYAPNDQHRACHLPLELCRIKEWETYEVPMTDQQSDDEPIPTPQDRYDAITHTLNACDYGSNSNSLLRAVGFNINCSEMLELEAKILQQPTILSGRNHAARVHNGHIYVNGQLFQPKTISKLAITYFGTDYQRNRSLTDRFSGTLLHTMANFNITVENFECTPNGVQNNMQQIDEYFHSKQAENYDFLVCIMHSNNPNDLTQLKHRIKLSGTIHYGIMTQCVLFTEIPKRDNLLNNYCETLIRKINYRNGGINAIVNLDAALKNRLQKHDSIMFIGGDVIHPTNVSRQHRSIAALVASADPICTKTAARVCQQYPKEGKCSIEKIIGMTEMMEQLLDFYRQENGRLPTKIVFYRDGVDNGQFATVQEFEIECIRTAFTKIYGTDRELPKLTFIVVQKRHNTRFFTYNEHPAQLNNHRNSHRQQQEPDETGNMPIGAVIDTKVIDDGHINFYLNSHNAFQGVNRPPHYHVLLNDIGFTVDELKLLTFYLCFTDGRSSAAEAIPSVLHQADLAALKARDLFFDDTDSSATATDSRSPVSRSSSSHELTYEILSIHDNLKNRPAFA